ncbi:MAG: UvrD-helicase domain-containing protein [Dermatophilaceae bacterium]
MTTDSPPVGAAPRAMAPFCVLGALPASGTTTLLEASAGTGKTWTIASLVTRYVLEGVCRLDELLVVTFGRAASEELRERVREQLVAAERVLAQGDTDEDTDPRVVPLVPLLLSGGAEEVAARHRRAREALSAFDAATIATTHQFCQLVLTGLGVAGDTDASARLVENLDDLMREVVDDLYVRGFAGQTGPPAFTPSDAMRIARGACGDPQARLQPREAEPTSAAARRRRFAEAVRSEFDRRKRRLGVLSYDDLLSQLADALADPHGPARTRMRQRWQVVLVDEFQDTDPVQWQVLDRAFTGHATVVLIGDPKQAIYAFRGGDVVTYLDAARTAGQAATLSTNHRCDGDLLAAQQAFLSGAALGDERIVVREVTAQHAGTRLRGAPHPHPLRLRLVPRAAFGEAGRRSIPMARLREHVAADLAADLAALLASGATFQDRPLLAQDVAVLCGTRRQGAQVAEALRSRSVPAVVGGTGSVFASEASRHWLALLEAMAQPHLSGRVRAAALTPFLGRSAADLDELGEAASDEDAETIRSWAEVLQRRGVAAAVEVAGAGGALAARVLRRSDGERLMTDLRHVAELLQQASGDLGNAPLALAAWLRGQRAQDPSTISSDQARRLDRDAAAVQVLTIHASKGLQFPVVYLPTLSDTHVRTPALPLYHDDNGRRCLDVGGAGPDDVTTRTAQQEEGGEQMRLLYVALTRAQSQVVTWWLPNRQNTPASPLHRLLLGRRPGERDVPGTVALASDPEALAAATAWEAVGVLSVELSRVHEDASVALPRPQGGRRPRRTFTREIDRDWARTSYTALAAAAAAQAHDPSDLPPTSEPEDPPRADEPPLVVSREPLQDRPALLLSPMGSMPVGAAFGSLVHAVLERADPAAPERGGDWRAELAHHVREQLLWWPVDVDPDDLAGVSSR